MWVAKIMAYIYTRVSLPSHPCTKGLIKQLVLSVCQLVCSSVQWNLTIRLNNFQKMTVALTFLKRDLAMCTSQETKHLCTLCFSSSFLFNVVIICHFIAFNTLVESGYSWTWCMFIVRWSLGISGRFKGGKRGANAPPFCMATSNVAIFVMLAASNVFSNVGG